MTNLDPTTLSPRQLEDLGPHDIHQLSLRAVNTLTRYRLLLGRCLLAMHRSQNYLQFGCSSAIHYATSAQQRQTQALAENAERSARNIAPWNALRAAKVTRHQNLQIVQKDKPHWNNPRARHLTPKQRIHILRRDGYRCQCPGCPNQLYLHVHHLTYYCQQGTTTPDNLITLCASCHRNLHNGHLHIQGTAPDNLTFLDGQGRNLTRQHRLEVAEWLDWFLGWPGSQDDSHRARVHR